MIERPSRPPGGFSANADPVCPECGESMSRYIGGFWRCDGYMAHANIVNRKPESCIAATEVADSAG